MYRKIYCPVWLCLVIIFSALLLMICISQSFRGGTVTTADTQSLTLPIIMYHSFLDDTALQNDYTINPKILEDDLKYIIKNGYRTVTTSDLIAYVKGEELPDKIVMLTFDDGFYNNYTKAYPLLKKYNCKGVLSPVASLSLEYTQNGVIAENYSYCTFDMLKEMENSGYIEIANHSFNMHKTSPRLGISQMKGESDKEYVKCITEDVAKAQKLFVKNNITEPICFTYPYGIESENTFPLIRQVGFKCTLTCQERTNIIYRDENCLFELGRYLRLQSESSEKLFERMLR